MAASRSASAVSALRGELIDILASSPRPPQPVSAKEHAGSSSRLFVSCVLFDVYGTLFSSASGDVGSSAVASDGAVFRAALERAGFLLRDEAVPDRARKRYFAEIARRHAEKRLQGIEYPEVDIASVWRCVLGDLQREGLVSGANPISGSERLEATGGRRSLDEDLDPCHVVLRTAAWYEALSNPVAPMPQLAVTVEKLAAAGILLGLVSNAQFYTPLLFSALLGREPAAMGFRKELCIWSYEVGQAKPSPEMFSIVLRRLSGSFGVGAESVLYVGNDMLNDVWAAKQAGCRAVLFAGDRRSLRLRRDDPRCESLRPDATITRLGDLLDVVVPAAIQGGHRA